MLDEGVGVDGKLGVFLARDEDSGTVLVIADHDEVVGDDSEVAGSGAVRLVEQWALNLHLIAYAIRDEGEAVVHVFTNGFAHLSRNFVEGFLLQENVGGVVVGSGAFVGVDRTRVLRDQVLVRFAIRQCCCAGRPGLRVRGGEAGVLVVAAGYLRGEFVIHITGFLDLSPLKVGRHVCKCVCQSQLLIQFGAIGRHDPHPVTRHLGSRLNGLTEFLNHEMPGFGVFLTHVCKLHGAFRQLGERDRLVSVTGDDVVFLRFVFHGVYFSDPTRGSSGSGFSGWPRSVGGRWRRCTLRWLRCDRAA